MRYQVLAQIDKFLVLRYILLISAVFFGIVGIFLFTSVPTDELNIDNNIIRGSLSYNTVSVLAIVTGSLFAYTTANFPPYTGFLLFVPILWTFLGIVSTRFANGLSMKLNALSLCGFMCYWTQYFVLAFNPQATISF